jgi:hypothetical protein
LLAVGQTRKGNLKRFFAMSAVRTGFDVSVLGLSDAPFIRQNLGATTNPPALKTRVRRAEFVPVSWFLGNVRVDILRSSGLKSESPAPVSAIDNGSDQGSEDNQENN